MNVLAAPEIPQWRLRHDVFVIDLGDIFAAALMLLTVAVFATMIWAGNHRH